METNLIPFDPKIAAKSAENFAELFTINNKCFACGLREKGCAVVFDDGSKNADLMIIGEAPGYNEHITGKPFAGKSGRLLRSAVIDGLGLELERVYLCNVMKCKPPENRDPTPEEMDLCSPWLYRQVELVNPKVIVTVGKIASHHFATPGATMGSMRGQVYSWKGIPVIPTWHPAFLLRRPEHKEEFWSDLQLAIKELETPLINENA